MIQRTKLLTLIVLGLLFADLSAQNDDFSNDPVAKLPDDDRKFRFGLQFSPNISWLKANTAGYESNGTKMGFSYGLSFEYFMSKNHLFSTGLFMLNSGGNLKFKGVTTYDQAALGLSPLVYPTDVKADFKIRQVEIPLLLKLRTNEIGYLTYFGQFGFKSGFNYKSSATYNFSHIDPIANEVVKSDHTFDDASDFVSFFNMSLVIGAGVEYNISGNTSLMLGLTYNNGFVNQLDFKVNNFDANGNPVLDSAGYPTTSSKNVSSNLNYVSLNIGIYF